MKHIAPPVLGALSFIGAKNEFVLIEEDREDPFYPFLSGKNNLIFSPGDCTIPADFDADYSAVAMTHSIVEVYRILKSVATPMEFIVINRIDLFNASLSKKARGSLIKAHLSMLASPTILRGAHLIVTSARSEYAIQEIANQHINLLLP